MTTSQFPFIALSVTTATVLIMLSSAAYHIYKRMNTGGEKKKLISMFVCTTCSIGKRIGGGDGNDRLVTGPSMFRGVIEKLLGIKDADLKETYQYSTEEAKVLIRPQECLGACKQANCIALTCPTKYSYHFTMLETVEDIEDLISFTRWYADDTGSSYTKKAGRPGKLGSNCVSRIPPIDTNKCE